MTELIYLDVWDIVLIGGHRVSVHAQSLSVVTAQDGSIARIDTTPWPGIATSLEHVVPSQVQCVLKRREQGTLSALHRLAGKVEYLQESAKTTITMEPAK